MKIRSSAKFTLAALLFSFAGLVSAPAQSIHLNAGVIDTSAAAPARQALAESAGDQLHLVQFDGPIQPEWVAQLQSAGYRIVDFIPDNTYLVYGGSAARKAVRTGLSHVQWEGAYLAADKISPRARPAALQARQLKTGVQPLFAVQLVLDEAVNPATLELIEALKLAPIRSVATNQSLRFLNVIADLPAESIGEIAARPDVVSIHPWVPPQLLCERQAQIVAGNLNVAGSQPSGTGYYAWLLSKGFTQAQFDSSGFIVDIADDGWDNGVAATPANREFRKFGDAAQASRVKYSRHGSTLSATASHGADGHGNINISIVGGFSTNSGSPFVDSAGYRRGQGICPFANLGNTKVFEDGGAWGPTEAQELAFIVSNYSSGVRISSDSWGMPGDGAYDVNSQNYDTWTRDSQPAVSGNQQVLYVFAAGNDGSGSSTIGAPGTGKNIVSVGAAENYNAFGTDGCGVADSGADNANDIIDFSSRGPCTDQRKKPDIMAPGTHVLGAASFYSGYTGDGVCDKYQPAGQTNYAASSGTSHSTPAVAGGAALVYQYFINQSWGTPSPAMVKAYLMNSTRYMTGVDANDTLPSNDQGMGMMNLGTAFDGVARILRDQSTNDLFTASGQSRKFYGLVSDTNLPLRVTLGWTDAPGSTSGNAYKNNLNLTVVAGGKTYLGNVFSGAFSTNGGTADVRNNVESVFLRPGVTGLVTITVTAFNINSDGVPNFGGALDQDFALVVANAAAFTPSNYPPVLDAIGNKSVSTNQLLQFTVTAADAVDNDSVQLWATGVPAWAAFAGATNTGTAASSFSGTAPSATGVYAVTFYAADKDGTNSESITITVNNCISTNIIDEGFAGGATAPADWTFTGLGTPYTSAGNYGRASPSLKFDGTGDQVITPFLNSPTNLQFWLKGQGTDASSALLVEGYNGSAWSTVVNVTPLPTTASTQAVVLADGLVQLRFTYTKSGGNLAFDDVIIGGCGGSAPPVNTAPVLSVAGGTNQSVAVSNELAFVVTASDANSDTVTLQTNSAPAGASFPGTNGVAPVQSTFTWTPTATGTYAAVFTADDGKVVTTQGVTIVVNVPSLPLPAPVIQAASDVQGTQFNANWLASDTATGYRLDVATNSSFASGGGGGVTNVSENIQSWTAHAGYGTWTQIIPAGTVNMTQCIVAPAAAASGVGSIGRVQLQATAGILELPALNTVGTITMNLAAGAIRTVKLQKFNGSTWDDLTTWSGIGTTGAAFSHEVNDPGSSVRLRIASPSGAIYVHDIIVTSAGGGGASSYVTGYENRDVASVTTFAVTGLTEGVTYYYRARAYNATSNSAYSATTNVTTVAGVDIPPVLGAIGNKSVTVGSNLQFQVSATPTDGDTVTLTVSNKPALANFYPTNEVGTFVWNGASPTGVYSVTFWATDENGSDSETITITVGEASAELLAPVIQAASLVQAAQFNANWLASANATGYRLDVATNSSFASGGGGSGGTLLSEDFNAWSGTWINGWTHNSGVQYTNGGVANSRCVGMNASADWIQSPAVTNPGTLSFYIRTSSDPGGWTVLVQTSPNGTDWTDRATIVEDSSGGTINDTPYQTNIALNLTGTFNVRWYMSARSADSCYIDNVLITDAGGGGSSYVPGYENRDVANVTTFAVTGLTEGVTYYYRARAYNATSNSAYSATTNVTTTAAVDVPPILAAIGNKSVTVGSNLQFQVSATPTDGDPVTLTVSNKPASADFYPTNENGTFVWNGASPTGVYSVTFWATDENGGDSETITITVGEGSSELLAPVIQAASLVQAAQFNANWLASANATGYRLDVGTNATFTGGGGGSVNTNLIAFDFSSYGGAEAQGTSTYAAVNMQTPALITRGAGLTATSNSGRFNAQGWSNHAESAAAFAAGDYFEWTIQPAVGYTMSITNIVMNIQRSNTGASNLALRASHDSFAADVATQTGLSGTATIVVTNDLSAVAGLQNVSGPITFRLAGWLGSSGGSLGFEGTDDDILIQGVISSGGGGGSSFVPGYQNRDVANVTTFAVTGLTESVTYYYRARAYNAASNSPYSAVTSVVTAASSGTPPVLNAIGGKEVFLGHTLQFAVSATPTEGDAVTLTVSNKPAGAELYATNANGTFVWTNASPTGEYSVVFYAADDDGSDGEAVGIYVYPLPVMGNITIPAGSSASVPVQSVAGQTYRLEYTVNLAGLPVIWTLADSEAGTGGQITLSDPTPTNIMRYYRVTIP